MDRIGAPIKELDSRATSSGHGPRHPFVDTNLSNLSNSSNLSNLPSGPVARLPVRDSKGKNDLNFIQINTNKSKRATDDLVIFAKKFANPLMLVQEPYANGKNIIPSPASDLKVFANSDRLKRPRACIYYHKCLQNKLWFMDSLTNEDCTTVQTKIDNTQVLLVSCYMDRTDRECPPQAFKDAVEYAKKNWHGFRGGYRC